MPVISSPLTCSVPDPCAASRVIVFPLTVPWKLVGSELVGPVTVMGPVTFAPTAAGMGRHAEAKGYGGQDLWGNESVAVGGRSSFDVSSAGEISVKVPAEGVALFRVTPLS